jgi:hypothetical protein
MRLRGSGLKLRLPRSTKLGCVETEKFDVDTGRMPAAFAALAFLVYASSLVDWYFVRPRVDGVVRTPPCRSSRDPVWSFVTRMGSCTGDRLVPPSGPWRYLLQVTVSKLVVRAWDAERAEFRARESIALGRVEDLGLVVEPFAGCVSCEVNPDCEWTRTDHAARLPRRRLVL